MPRPSLAATDTATIHAELRRRRGLAAQVAAMRDRLRAKVVVLDARIAEWGATPNGVPQRPRATTQRRRRGGRGSRPARAGSLASVLSDALKSKTMTVTQAVAAARAAGYRSTSKTFYQAVAAVLSRSGRFRRVGRGRYKAR